jgi:hypothetical protein
MKDNKNLDAWIITNEDRIEPEAEKFALENNIKIYNASLSHNWKGRVDWKVTNLKELKIKDHPSDSL